MQYITGRIWTPDGFIDGCIDNNEGKISIHNDDLGKTPLASGLILPSMTNMHTHIGDTFIRQRRTKLPNDLRSLVEPPEGLKHRMLREANAEEISSGMLSSISEMKGCGTSCFMDFREGGSDGVGLLKGSLDQNRDITGIILSRPATMSYHEEEIEELLDISDGIGLSSISEWKRDDLLRMSDHAHEAKKIFSLHASERVREDIDHILELEPDILVHMIQATDDDLTKVKETEIPIVICPRSNMFFNLKTNYASMNDLELTVLLGSDNGMLHPPDVSAEARTLLSLNTGFSLEKIVDMLVVSPKKCLIPPHCCRLHKYGYNHIVVLDEDTLDVAYVSGYRSVM